MQTSHLAGIQDSGVSASLLDPPALELTEGGDGVDSLPDDGGPLGGGVLLQAVQSLNLKKCHVCLKITNP